MRFNIFVVVSLCSFFAAGAVLPSRPIASRDELQAREDPNGLLVNLVFREPASAKNRAKYNKRVQRNNKFYKVAGSGPIKTAQTWQNNDIKAAVNTANKLTNASKTQREKKFGLKSTEDCGLKRFYNKVHDIPKKPGVSHARPLPEHAGARNLWEIPLKNRNKGTDKSPARVIMQSKNQPGGTFRAVAVVAHDQSRTHGTLGGGDHFRVRPVKKKH
ncbi:hypothetical protein CPB83DRAFT_893860 [Crepidotus variabilis]|uniref:Secreted protein n=1 Tax=Crepidotus variabilis TaxID=179855 RepID=A0A9P6EHB8_9AGAR|nr:hypothetical protein CPB83DRAFT_893860 [Crepidotus variabilis]